MNEKFVVSEIKPYHTSLYKQVLYYRPKNYVTRKDLHLFKTP
jgi:hypothetical protein